MTICTKYVIGSNAFWECHGIFSEADGDKIVHLFYVLNYYKLYQAKLKSICSVYTNSILLYFSLLKMLLLRKYCVVFSPKALY